MRNSPHFRQVAFLLLAAAAAARADAQTATVAIDATKPVRVVDNRQFGANAPFWDNTFTSATSLDSLTEMGTTIMRFGGGSATDEYNWQTNTDIVSGDTWAFNVDAFAARAAQIGAQAIITTNYGSGTPAEAQAYVTYANVTNGYGFKYWEIGNECYGTWEHDTHTLQWDPYTYGTWAAQYITAMKSADPTIKVGVVAVTGEDSDSNGYTAHPATNPVTNVAHNGWTPVMLATMKAAGVLPDFLIYHRYEQNAGSENDSVLLQDALTWPQDAASLRGMLTDYLGSAGAGIELLVTENNSVSTSPGKQSVSLVNGLYYADSTANLMQTEFNALTWWDFHNGQAFNSTSAPINISSSLYGWRLYGDYGFENQPTNDRYPVFYVAKLLTHFARGGDTVISATSNDTLLSAYAVKRANGTVSVLVINKSPTATTQGNFTITGFSPKPNATVYSYGIPQDIAAENAAAPSSGSGPFSSWENALDGWVNQSGQPDTTATNYGLNAPFLYTTAFSTSTGVTDGTASLACTTTNADPGDSAVIQNSSASIGTAFSNAASVSVDIYPQIAAGSTVQASIYINGNNIPYALLGTVTLNVNQENTATFNLTSAQRTGIAASLGSGNYFQVGININAPAPITVYFDNFTITPASTAPAPTPVPGGASSPDVAVTSISNAGPTFSASFAPYSATVISLSSAPQIVSQPNEQFTTVGGSATFSVTAAGASTLTYQWYFNGAPIDGATTSTYSISSAQASNAGTYTVTVTDSDGSITSSPVNLSVNTGTSTARLTNISTRALVGTGGNILIPGLYISGAGTETLLIRADGPVLTQYGVSGVLATPTLSVFDSTGTLVASNTGWGTGPNASQIPSISASVGAFALPANSADCALIANLTAGAYTVQISGVGNTTGVALAEVYEVSASGTARLANISTRAMVGTGGNILIPGFYISGTGTEELLVRADGPALTQYGVGGVLTQPTLSVYNASGALVATNTVWGTGANASQIPGLDASLGAFALATGSTDSAQIVSLAPGGYTIQVSGVSGTTGVALAEIYEVP